MNYHTNAAWRDKLKRGSTGSYLTNLFNAAVAVRCFELPVYYDEMRCETMLSGPLPWDAKAAGRAWADVDDMRFAEILQHTDLRVVPATVAQAVEVVAHERKRHPLREYLNGLQWDGVHRVGWWLPRYLGADDTTYNQTVGKLWLISAVARIMKPGCKVDHMLILEGPQGKGKSAALKALCRDPSWFSDTLPPITDGGKDARAHLRGTWIVEMAELTAMRKSSVEALKAFITTTADKFRPAYGRRDVTYQRQCVFAGTVNDDKYLSDPTGNRRFWPVKCGDLDIAGIERDRDQLWAEAAYLLNTERRWWPVEGETADMAEQQAERVQDDSWEPWFIDWINERADSTEDDGELFKTADILFGAARMTPDKMTHPVSMRACVLLRKLGLENKDRRLKEGGHGKFWKAIRIGVDGLPQADTIPQKAKNHSVHWWTDPIGGQEFPL